MSSSLFITAVLVVVALAAPFSSGNCNIQSAQLGLPMNQTALTLFAGHQHPKLECDVILLNPVQ
jgi:hypothetical protein